MADDKNLFNFGTGNIKRDQWLRDIDSEQDAFISRYTNATNKRKGLLLRLAFAELRKRIGSGDMLGRDDAGSFQFASSLNNEDKDVLEAQLRALGFMAELGRRLVQAPAAEPEKKGIGDLEERYIKSLNPTGKFNTKAYWNSQTDDERRNSLISFLNGELGRVDSYLDFGSFETKDNYKERLNNVLGLLRDSKANDWTLQLLGFTKNWLAKSEEEKEEEAPKSELEKANERLQAATEAQQVQQINLLVAALTAPSPTYQALLTFNPSDYWNYDSFVKDRNKRIEALKYIDANGNEFLKANSILRRTPTGNGYFTNQVTTKNTAWNGLAAKDARTYALSQYAQEVSSRLNNYFKNLGVNYQSILNNDKRGLMTNLAQLFTQGPDNNYVMSDVLNDLFVRLLDGKFGLRGSTLSYDPSTHTLYNGSNIDAYKEGGILKELNGLIVDDSYYVKPTNNIKKVEETPKLENSEEMDAGDWVTIAGTTIADIGSMLSANAPGYGTAISAGLGVTSTLGNSVNEFRHGNIGAGLFNLGIGLGADAVGLIPGVGAGAKSIKIGRTITRFARPLMAAMSASNLKEAADGVTVILKGLRNGFGSLTADDWLRLSAGLISTISMVTRGKATNRRQNNVELYTRASQHSSPKDAKGNITKHIINEEGYVKARKELMDERPSIFNSTSKFSDRTWRSIPEGGEVNSPFFAHPIDWSNFGFGRQKKLDQLEKMENLLKERKKSDSSLESSVVVPNEKLGGILKALRNGGIIKADDGLKSPVLANPSRQNGYAFEDWAQLEFGTDLMHAWDWRDHNRRMGTNLKESYGLYNNDEGKLDLNSARSALYNYHTYNGGNNIMGDVVKYYNDWIAANPGKSYQDFANLYNSDVDWLRDYNRKKLSTEFNTPGWEEFNTRHHRVYGSYGLRDQNGKTYDDWNVKLAPDFGESTMRRVTNSFANAEEYKDKRTGLLSDKDTKSRIFMDNNGHIFLADLSDDGVKEVTPGTSGSTGQLSVVDKLDPKASIYNTEFKNPMDPTPFITAGKTALGLFGNKDIYGNLLKEYPHPALQDPLHRQLAIVGDLRAIDDAKNKLGDLRRILQQLIGYDPSRNFATSLETERVGREILDNGYNKDATRQFDTAQKLWNLKNEDTFTNWRMAYENRKAIENYNKTLAQIRAAWRSGNNNILMGAAADTGNWLMKRFQREQDTVDRARALALGTPEEWAQSEYTSRLGDLANKKASDMTEQEKAKAEAIKALVLREMRLKYSEKYYTNFNNGWFGGGYKEKLLGKNGTKLEVEKLKARSKDNDRYVSMIKDLRTTKRRRR